MGLRRIGKSRFSTPRRPHTHTSRWLPQDSFNQSAHFPPQQAGNWPDEQYPTGPLDYQGATFDTIPSNEDLDGLLNPPPANFPSDVELGPAKQRVRQRISSPAKAILQNWFDDHIEDPYLEREDVSTLSEATGLTPRQVRTFFANARARKLPGPVPSQPSPSAHSSADSALKSKHRQQCPMQRYLSSSPEDEGLSEEALRRAATSYTPQSSAQPNTKPPKNADGISEAASSNSSNSSQASIDSAVNRIPRRGRKRHRGSLRRTKTVARGRLDQSKIFQCTFCNRDFAQKYDWRRHEESVHIPQKEWICMPDGPLRPADDDSGTQSCVFCEQPTPSYEHLQRHNYAPCLTAPQPSRTFTRKDKLIQHLGQVHKQPHMSPTMQSWCRRVSRNVIIACGMCGLRLSTWNERVEHISIHFADGLDMRYWLGAPGGVASLTSPNDDSHHHQHYQCEPFSASSTSAAPAAIVDSLFPTYNPHNPSSSSSTTGGQPGFYHPCIHCPARFPRYSDTVFHERQAHRVYKIRPQPTDDGRNILNPLQSQTEKGSLDKLSASGAAAAGRGAMPSFAQQQQQQRMADPPVAAAVWGGGSGTRSRGFLGGGGEKSTAARVGGAGRPL